jgi:glycosyltransferase involved in cell wall biosynthesis
VISIAAFWTDGCRLGLRRACRLFRPALGVLRQYAPRPLRLPKRYGKDQPPADPPRIALVTPSLNQGAFLERTLRSVLEQRYPGLDYIVQDGGSTDATRTVLARYADRLQRYQSAPDHGQADALNRGFRGVTADILAYLNADDLLLPGSLAYVASYFAAHPEVDVVYGHRIVIDEGDREIGRWVLPPHDNDVLLWRDYVPQETLFWRRRLWERVGAAFEEDLQFVLDWELLLRFRAARARFARLPRFLGAFRVHEQQKTIALFENAGRPEIEQLLRRWHGRSVSEAEVERRVRPYLRRHMMYQRLYEIGLLRY